MPLSDGTNSLEAETDADTLAGNSPSSDTASSITLDTAIDEDYTYNANGDLIQKTEGVNGTTVQWDYTYDVQGWLIEVEKIVGGQTTLVEEYAYDPAGRKYKVSVTEDSTTTTRYFVYDGGSVLLELGSSMELAKEFVRGLSLGGGIGGLLYVREEDESLGYFHYDGQGNVVSVTDESRTEVAYYECDAWGNLLTACGSLANEFLFSTKQASTGTGLVDFGYRWYDPSVGRWTQRDPVGIRGGSARYLFAADSPANGVDPWGDTVTWQTAQNQQDAAERAKFMWSNLRAQIEKAAQLSCKAKFLLKLIDFLDSDDVTWDVRVQWDVGGSTGGLTWRSGATTARSFVNLGRRGTKPGSAYYTLIHEAFHAAERLGFGDVEWCACLDDTFKEQYYRTAREQGQLPVDPEKEFGAVYVENILRGVVGHPVNWRYPVGETHVDFSPYADKIGCKEGDLYIKEEDGDTQTEE